MTERFEIMDAILADIFRQTRLHRVNPLMRLVAFDGVLANPNFLFIVGAIDVGELADAVINRGKTQTEPPR